MWWAFLALPALAGKSAPDDDGDGIRDRDDECVFLAERFNGYFDEDGCPDYLASLQVRTWIDHDQIPADLEVQVGPRQIRSDAPLLARDLVPGDVAVIEARHGCWVGSASERVLDGTTWIDIELQPKLDALATLGVTDPEGTPVPGARATWISEVDGCAPESTALPYGAATVQLGAGRHAVRVSANGYEPKTVPVGVMPGEQLEVDVILVPSVPEDDVPPSS